MKLKTGALTLFASVFLLAACGNSGQEDTTTSETAETSSETVPSSEDTSGDDADDNADDSNESASSSEANQAASGEFISEDEAWQIALDDAGTTEDALTEREIELDDVDDDDDYDDVAHYEIEFTVDGDREFEYDIDATTGNILNSEKDN
ncbi:PepSY domain-containing protein [Aerococcus viridans]|uniref:PepSY domain-containing protein n=1 Tax=Aerococcus viridans TaxID=1377 RepID=UPI0002FA2794|nr:PepSY domain-containing protein [Aerococcus viridans]